MLTRRLTRSSLALHIRISYGGGEWERDYDEFQRLTEEWFESACAVCGCSWRETNRKDCTQS